MFSRATAQDVFEWLGDSQSPTYSGIFSNPTHWMGSNGAQPPPDAGDTAWFKNPYDYTVTFGGQTTGFTLVDQGTLTFDGTYTTGTAQIGNSFGASVKLSSGDTLTINEHSTGALFVANYAVLAELVMEGAGADLILTQGSGAIANRPGSYGFLKMLSGGHASITGWADTEAAIIFGVQDLSHGTGIIDGSDSLLEINRGGLEIGRAGEGKVYAQQGGNITVDTGGPPQAAINLGVAATGNGLLVVDGENSLVQIKSGGFEAGRDGEGVLNVVNGGHFIIAGQNYRTLLLGGVTGSGTAVVSGEGSELLVRGGRIEIGDQGLGEIYIVEGGLLNLGDVNSPSPDMRLGAQSTGSGYLAVADSGSKCEMKGQLAVGVGGSGRVDVAQGGLLKITAVGETPAIVVGGESGSNGELWVLTDDSGSKVEVEEGSVVIGGAGTATMGVAEGTELKLKGAGDALIVGNASGANGTLTVRGPNAQVTTQGKVIVGKGGQGSITLEPFSIMTSTAGEIGMGGEGTVEVQDNATWSSLTSGEFIVGGSSKGTLIVRQGGMVSCPGATLVLAKEAGSEGTVYLIEGGVSGNLFASEVEFGVGKGSLFLQEYTLFRVDSLAWGRDAGAESAVYLETSSSLHASGNLVVGGEGDGYCHADDSSFLVAEQTIQVKQGGHLEIEHELVTRRLELEGGSVSISGTGYAHARVEQFLSVGPGGTLEVAGSCTMSVGSIAVSGPGAITITAGGKLECAGTIQAKVINAGGEVRMIGTPAPPAPGAAQQQGALPAMGIQGSYEQTANSELRFIIAGTIPGTEYSQLIAQSATIDGKVILDFQQGFAPASGQTFDLVQSSNTVIGPNVTVDVRNLAVGFQYSLAVVGNVYRLTVLADAVAAPVCSCALEHVPGLYLRVDYTGILQSSPDLANWTDVPGTTGISFRVPQPEMTGSRFFRVRSF